MKWSRFGLRRHRTALAVYLLGCLLCVSGFGHPLIDDKAERKESAQPGARPTITTGSRTADVFTIKTERGPLIRVGLMTDVSAISLSSSTGLALNPETGGVSTYSDRDSREAGRHNSTLTFSTKLRVSLARAAVRIEVGRFTDPERALDLASDLEDDYSEPVLLSYDESHSKFAVYIGEYKSEAGAQTMLSRLKRDGYKSAVLPAPNASPRLEIIARDPESDLAWSTDLLAVKAAQPTRAPKMESRNIVAIRDTVGSTSKSNERIQTQSPIDPQVVRVGEKAYRGQIEIAVNRRGLLNVINVVPLEDYLRGVVPSEISPSSFPEIEALKAQAVAARTYALVHATTTASYRNEGFDLTDDARSQVYGGYSAEHPLTSRAVEETRGLVALYGGKPIEALYTSTCGGHTENSEAVFPGQPQPYLRAVSCAADKVALSKHQLKTGRSADSLVGSDGHSVAREFALLDSLEFGLPRRPSPLYLKSAAARDELRKWAERAASLTGERRLASARGDITHLAGFASLVASSVFGEAAMLMAPADVDYLLDGLGGENLSRESRADLALLIAAGVLRPLPDARLVDSISVSRAQAIEAFARGLALRFDIWSSEGAGFVTRILSARFSPASISFRRAITAPAEDGRLRITGAQETTEARGTSGQQNSNSRKGSDSGAGSSQLRGKAPARNDGFEIAPSAWLLRRLGGESYPVNHLVLIGGESVTFHVDSDGRIDYLELESSSRGASSDRVSSASYWQVRMTANELEQRLARARINVGDLLDLVPVAYGQSNRVLEIEVQGSRETARLRGSQVRSVLGLKEALFVISRSREQQPVRFETVSRQGERDRWPDVFVFTGRGWGHGVGMCQTGAYGLAKEGYTYTDILKTYYSGISLKRLY